MENEDEKVELTGDVIPMIEHKNGELHEAVPVVQLATGQFVVHPTAVERFIKKVLTNGAEMAAFDAHWTHQKYFLAYRIGIIEEMISFTPEEIQASISVMAKSAVEHLVRMGSKDRLLIPPVEWLVALLEGAQIHYMGAVEYYVRNKHRLPMPRALIDKAERRLMKSLFRKGRSSRREDALVMWSMIVFAAAKELVSTTNNCLVVEDQPASRAEVEGAERRARAHFWDAAEIEAQMPSAETLGVRNYSTRMLPCA